MLLIHGGKPGISISSLAHLNPIPASEGNVSAPIASGKLPDQSVCGRTLILAPGASTFKHLFEAHAGEHACLRRAVFANATQCVGQSWRPPQSLAKRTRCAICVRASPSQHIRPFSNTSMLRGGQGRVRTCAAEVLTNGEREPAAAKLADLYARVRPFERAHHCVQDPGRNLPLRGPSGSDGAVLAAVE